MNKLVCICGMAGSGKSVLSDYFTEHGYQFVRFGQVVLDEIIKLGLNPSEKNQNTIRKRIRKKYGMAGVAALNEPIITKKLKRGNVVADGLYSWSEYKYLKKRYVDKFILIAVFSPPEIRYKRLAKRKPDAKDKKLRNHHFSVKEAKKRDYHEIEDIEKGGPIAMADYTVLNTGTLEDYKKQISKIFNRLN